MTFFPTSPPLVRIELLPKHILTTISIDETYIQFYSYTGPFDQLFEACSKSSDSSEEWLEALSDFRINHCQQCDYYFDTKPFNEETEEGHAIRGEIRSCCDSYRNSIYLEEEEGCDCEQGLRIPARDDYESESEAELSETSEVSFVFTSRAFKLRRADSYSQDYKAALCNIVYDEVDESWYTSAQLRGLNVDGGFGICFGGARHLPSLKSAAAAYLDSSGNEDYIDIDTFKRNLDSVMSESYAGSLNRPIPSDQVVISSTQDELYDGFLYAHRQADADVYHLLIASGIPPISDDFILCPIRHHLHQEGDHTFAGFITEPNSSGMCWFIDNTTTCPGLNHYRLIATIPHPSLTPPLVTA